MSETYRSREERKKAEKKKQEEQQGEATPKKKGSFFKKFLIACLLLGIVTVGAGVSAFFTMVKDAPELDAAKLADPLSTKFYDKDGVFIHEYGEQKRTKITYDQVPKVLEDAFLATEDARFYEHHGIDIKRTAKAIFENVTEGFGSQGGSTITQQVIKNAFLTNDKKLKRKVQEWYLAYKLEQEFSKHEILEMYLNKINLGGSSHGIAAAAKKYYGIEADNLKALTLPQAAMLAGLPQSPNNYNPQITENQGSAKKRRDIVLSLMFKHGFISEQQMNEAINVPVTEGLQPIVNDPMPYQAFLDAAVKEVEAQLKDVDINTDGLQIYTTLDRGAQEYADKILDTQEVVNYPNDQFQAAFIFMETKTGEVRAIGSGRNEHKAKFRGNNFAISIDRQPGSTFKPVFDYGPAIEHLKWSTYHQIENPANATYSTGDPINNWTNKYDGIVSARLALQWSLNIPALNTMRAVGKDKAQAFAESLGITFKDGQTFESTAIGSNAVNPLEMAGAYAPFGNGGSYVKPYFVTKVVFPDGKEVNFKQEPQRVMKDYTAYMITDMLRTVVKSGTGTLANVPGLDVAGKTGTTNYDAEQIATYGYPSNATSDSWFVGYTTQYTMSVWTGYAKNEKGLYMSSANGQEKIAKYIFKQMMAQLATDKSQFQRPDSVESISGELYVKGNIDDLPKTDAPSELDAKYDQATNQIVLSWSYPEERLPDVTFEVSYSENDGPQKVLSSNKKDMTLTIGKVKESTRYTFYVTAKRKSQSSDPVKITVTTPDPPKKETPEKPPADDSEGDNNGGGNAGDDNGGNAGDGNGGNTGGTTDDNNNDNTNYDGGTNPLNPFFPSTPAQPEQG